MAYMIPERLPDTASRGEQLLFNALKELTDDCLVYYEPIIANRYPDFIVIMPDLGIMIIEVKGWFPNSIVGGDSHKVDIAEKHGTVQQQHPLRQARNYMFLLIDECKKHSETQALLNQSGTYKNRFMFPFGAFAILSNITKTQLVNHKCGNLTTIFKPENVATRDLLLKWKLEDVTHDEIQGIIRSYFIKTWEFERLTERQVDILRAIIHPEILVNSLGSYRTDTIGNVQEVDIKVLDLKQEENARKIGKGHRIIYGIAGSGKTIILISRARLLSQDSPDSRILFTCYNVTLSIYLRQALKDCKNVDVLHFDGLAKSNSCTRIYGQSGSETDKELGDRLLTKLSADSETSRKYDAVMIDEAQDFPTSWFQCILAMMKDPEDGDLVIVGDASQGLYPQDNISWKKIGIKARGRTISNSKFNLDKNYRNSREIIEFASIFASVDQEDVTDDSILAVKVEPSKCQRSTGILPVFLKSQNKVEESRRILEVVQGLLHGYWMDKRIEPLLPNDIGILYARKYHKNDDLFSKLIQDLNSMAPTIWISETGGKSRKRIADDGIKVQTIHSAKGLQYKAVIIMWANHLPSSYFKVEDERRLFYVGLTRPEDYLAISASGKSSFINEIQESPHILKL